MSENKRLLVRYDVAVQSYARLLAAAIGGENQADIGYDLIESAVKVEQTRDLVMPYAEQWMLEYIAVATNMLKALAALAVRTARTPQALAAAERNVSAYEAMRTRFFTAEDFAAQI